MLDYGWRQYMPDLGRWNGMDALSESYQSTSPYAYVMNNPVLKIDPNGMLSQAFMDEISSSASGTTWTNNNNGTFTNNWGGMMNSKGRALNYRLSAINSLNNDGGGSGPKPGFWGSAGIFLRKLFSRDKGAGISTIVPGAAISRIPALEIGNVTFRGILSSASIDAVILGITRAGVWSLPLMLNGDSGFSANSKPITDDTDISGEISKGDNNRNGILLYRGVSSSSHSEAQATMYNEALFGIAIPNGLRPENIYRAHWDMDDHAMSDNISVWTSWTTNKETARYFATGVSGKSEGVILSKRFKIGVNAIPNVSETGKRMQENEWLIFGPVIRANVEHIKP